MTIPGFYDISGGKAEVKPDGSIIFHQLTMKPAPLAVEEKPLNLKERWKDDNKLGLTYPAFRKELDRNGHLLKDNTLTLTGKQVRALYRFLSSTDCLPMDLSMVDVYQMFAASFKLKIKSHSSLQRLVDEDDDCLFWSQTFAFCVSDSNAIQDNDNLHEPTDI